MELLEVKRWESRFDISSERVIRLRVMDAYF